MQMATLLLLAAVTSASLRGLSAVSDAVVWASGSGGTVLRTSDGGTNWSVMHAGDEKTDFRDVEAFDAETAVIMSTSGKIYRTTDGGANWTLAHDDKREGIFLDAIAFRDRKHGYALGDPMGGRFVLLETRDGGATWSDLPDDRRPAALEGEAAFAASGTCLAVTKDGAIWIVTGGKAARALRSGDGGRTWSASQLPMVSGNESSGAFGISVSRSRAIVVGGDYRRPNDAGETVVATSDGGKTWRLIAALPFRSGVVTEGKRAIATGTGGTDVTHDGGRTWKRVGEGYNAAGCTPRACFLAGSEGRIQKLPR